VIITVSVVFTLAALALLSWYVARQFRGDAYNPRLTLNISNADKFLPGPLVNQIEREPHPQALSIKGILQWTNKYRQDYQLAHLILNDQLVEATKRKIEDMEQNNYFDHISPTGKEPSSFADDVNYRYLKFGENLALGVFANNQSLVEAWMNSPGHRENILQPKFKEIGIYAKIVNYNKTKVWFAVQMFARPASECAEPNEALKIEIDQLIKRYDQMVVEARNMEAVINSLDSDSKNAKIEEYNSLVKRINQLAVDLDHKISSYNSQVKTYNNCLKE